MLHQIHALVAALRIINSYAEMFSRTLNKVVRSTCLHLGNKVWKPHKVPIYYDGKALLGYLCEIYSNEIIWRKGFRSTVRVSLVHSECHQQRMCVGPEGTERNEKYI